MSIPKTTKVKQTTRWEKLKHYATPYKTFLEKDQFRKAEQLKNHENKWVRKNMKSIKWR